MPLYEFACPACGYRFDELCPAPVDEKDCPRCGKGARRKFAAFAFQSGGSFRTSSSSRSCSGCGGGGCSTCGR